MSYPAQAEPPCGLPTPGGPPYDDYPIIATFKPSAVICHRKHARERVLYRAISSSIRPKKSPHTNIASRLALLLLLGF